MLYFPPSIPPNQIVLKQQAEVLALDCEMSAVHSLLSKIPDNLNYEEIIKMAYKLFKEHSPKKLAKLGGLDLSARYPA